MGKLPYIVTVPDSLTRRIVHRYSNRGGTVLTVAREDEGMGVAAGLACAGKGDSPEFRGI